MHQGERRLELQSLFVIARGLTLWISVSLGLICLMLLCGCQAPQARADDAVRLRAWTMWGGEEAEAFQKTLDAFNATHPGIRVENLPAVDDPKIIRAIVADDPPELFTLKEPSYLGSLAGNNAIEFYDPRYLERGNHRAVAPAKLDDLIAQLKKK